MDRIRKKYKPVTPGTRHQVRIVPKGDIGYNDMPKSLIVGKISTGGRNNNGRIVSYNRGSGHKRVYRHIARSIDGTSTVLGFNYDPNRTSYTALTIDSNGVYSNVLATTTMKVGDIINNGNNVSLTSGNTTARSNITIGTWVHNIQLYPNSDCVVARAAGAYARLVRKTDTHVTRRMPSAELRLFKPDCIATIGQVSGASHFMEIIGKAGRNRNRGWRSCVRGVAINPIDHPHGGRTKGGRSDVTPWAWPTKGQPTRLNRKNSFYIVK